MNSSESSAGGLRQLRMVQIACTFLALSASVLVANFGKSQNQRGVTTIHWLIILAAIYSAVSAFTLQKTLTKGPARSEQSKTQSSQYSRWRAGHIVRLFFPASVATWGAVLAVAGGPLWLAYSFCGLGVLLLVIWSPGAAPPQ